MAFVGGIVLAGGRSSRMGRPKAELDWYGQPLLVRVAGLLHRSLDGPVVVVRAPGQPLPPLPGWAEIVDDAQEGRGPLEGIAAGMRALQGRTEAAYVTSTDVPLLHPTFVTRVVSSLDELTDVVVPVVDGHRQPLAAAYRLATLPVIERLLEAGRLRPAFLFDEARTRFLDSTELLHDPALHAADPELHSVRNLNDPGEYTDALALGAPQVSVERFGTLRTGDGPAVESVRAATLGGAAQAVGVTLDRHVVAAINGDRMTADPGTPLAAGDFVALISADAGG